MQYVMILVGDESKWESPDLPENLMDEIGTWWDKWHQAGKVLDGGAELAPSSTAKTIGPGADGAPAVTDGPFAEAKEYLCSFTIIDVESHERALEIARRNPAAEFVGIEVRPLTHEAAMDV